MLLASCSYEESKKYRNKLVLVSDDVDTGKGKKKKAEEVLLNIVTDTPDEILKSGIGSAKCVTTRVKPTICPENLKGNVFYEVDYDRFTGVDCDVEGVVTLVRLPDGFCDMRKAEELMLGNEAYDDVEAKVRVIGGNLLEIPGVHIGRYDKGKEKMSSVFNGIYDIFKEVTLSDIKVQEVMPKFRSKSSNGSRPKASGVKKPNSRSRKSESFAKFFGDTESEF